jgi:hypothetical protein
MTVPILTALVLCGFAKTGNSQQRSLAEVVASTPDRANAMLFVDVPSVRSFVQGTPLFNDLNEMITEVRIAAELNLKSMQPNWEIGYVGLKGVTESNLLAKKVGGYVDSIAGASVVWSPSQSYLVPVSGDLLGFVRPSDRKLASRWLKKQSDKSASPYLKKHAAETKFVSVLLAIDLEDVWSPIAIEQRTESLESIKSIDRKKFASTLSSIQGIRFMVNRKNLDDCIIGLDFTTSPDAILPIAKPFFVEVLTRNQASIPEVANWKVSIEENSLLYRGKINAATLDDLLGIFTVQRQASNLPSENSSSADVSAEKARLEASKNFFGKMTSIVDRVREYSAVNTGDRAQWNGKMARRIDELPTLNVDPELVQFGAKISEGLRGNMVALQQANISYGTNAVVNSGVGVYSTYNDVYGAGYGYYYDVNAPAKYQAAAQGAGNFAYRDIIAKIDQMVGDMRRAMTDKYQVQF